MLRITTSSEVFDLIQKAKTGAAAFCTNFFPVQPKLDSWIAHGELFAEARDSAAFFYRKDRDFWHWYYCARDLGALARESKSSRSLTSQPMVVDVVGREGALDNVVEALRGGGFKPHSRLVRLARPAKTEAQSELSGVTHAGTGDAGAVQALIESAFDRYADQLPAAYELEAATAAGQILAVRDGGELAAVLYFETQGFTSTVRYWVVAEQYREKRYGSALIRHYFSAEKNVRRFVLWVTAANENAAEKYRHYGYIPDGLVDHVLINDMIRA
jgi:hypothetical protein